MRRNQANPPFRFTVGRKILLSLMVSLLMILAVGGYSLNQMQLIGAEVEEISEIALPTVRSITKIEKNQLEQIKLESYTRKSLRKYLLKMYLIVSLVQIRIKIVGNRYAHTSPATKNKSSLFQTK